MYAPESDFEPEPQPQHDDHEADSEYEPLPEHDDEEAEESEASTAVSITHGGAHEEADTEDRGGSCPCQSAACPENGADSCKAKSPYEAGTEDTTGTSACHSPAEGPNSNTSGSNWVSVYTSTKNVHA